MLGHHDKHHHNTTNTTNTTGMEQNRTHGASTISEPNYHPDSSSSYNAPIRDSNLGSTSGHHHHSGTTGLSNQQYGSTGTTGLGNQQYGTTGTTGTYSGTSGMTTGGVKTMHTVESVTRDAQAQIDAQAEEAIRKSRELNAQDHARLQASIREATSSLEEQARQLKAQIDQEKLAAEQSVRQTQQQKLSATAQTQQMEEQKILEAAARRKLELEQKSMRLQQEIDEIVRRKTAEMMQEKPGNLCFTHQHQDTTVGAQLAGDIGHIIDLKQSGRVTEATMQGNVQYQPVQVQQTISQPNVSAVQAQEHTVQGPEVHEKKGGFFHALKTAITGESHGHHHDQNVTATSTHTTGMTGKQEPLVGNRAYDQQSTWASDADKHMPHRAQ